MFRYLFPDLKNIGVIYSKKYNHEWVTQTRQDAKDVNIKIISKSIRRSSELGDALREVLPKVDAVWLTSDPVVMSNKDSVQTFFKHAQKKPIFSYDEVFLNYGASLIISPDIPTIGFQAANLANELNNGIEISERVQDPAGSSITLNLKKVNQYGIQLNKDALDSVNNILE